MQEAILTNVIHFAPIGILALLLIMVLILVANLRQTKKINKIRCKKQTIISNTY